MTMTHITNKINVGRYYHDKSTKTLFKYSHDRLEIKAMRCIHKGVEKKNLIEMLNVWVHVVNGRVFARSNKYTF